MQHLWVNHYYLKQKPHFTKSRAHERRHRRHLRERKVQSIVGFLCYVPHVRNQITFLCRRATQHQDNDAHESEGELPDIEDEHEPGT